MPVSATDAHRLVPSYFGRVQRAEQVAKVVRRLQFQIGVAIVYDVVAGILWRFSHADSVCSPGQRAVFGTAVWPPPASSNACQCSSETGMTDSRLLRTSANSRNRLSALIHASVTGDASSRLGLISNA